MILSIALPQLVFADAPLVVERPRYQVGDTWEYATQDKGDPAKPPRTHTECVTAIDPDGTVTIGTTVDDRGGRIVLDANGDYVKSNGWNWTPNQPTVRFPLVAGDSWSTEFRWTNPSAATGIMNGKNTVVGRERIHVRAGDFDAIKIEIYGQTRPDHEVWFLWMHDEVWYAPAVNRVILRKYSRTTSRSTQHWQQELVGYRLKEPVPSH